jgi:prefoldin alpha subunit
MKDGVAAKQYVELELLNKQVQNLERQVQLTDQEIEHGVLALRMLDEFSQAKTDQEILIPLGSGAFCSVQAGDVRSVKMAVGAGVLIEREANEAKSGLEKQLQQLKQHREHSLELHDELIDKIVAVQQEIEMQLEQR